MLPRVDVRAKRVIGAKRSKGEKLLLHRDDGGIEDRAERDLGEILQRDKTQAAHREGGWQRAIPC